MKKISNKIKVGIFITSIFVIFMSVTYAFIAQTLTGTKEVVINAGVLDLVLEEENEITISDALPMYDEVGMIQDDVFVFRLVNKTSNPTNYILKLSKINATNELSPSDIKYYLTKEGVGEPKLLSTLPSDGTVDSGIIAGNDTIDYTLRLWIDSNVTNETAISGKTLSYRIGAELSQEIVWPTGQVTEIGFDESLIGENCKTYNDGIDTFLVGQCSQNYVWYSGKLWRIVLKNNETGAVKMVTEDNLTTIAYNPDGNTAFENSYVDQWLNQEFLPTLHNYEDYLETNNVWNATNSSYSDLRPDETTQVTRSVGLLNIYEYNVTYYNSYGLATTSNVYLNNNSSWWTMTPYGNNSSLVWYIKTNGSPSDNSQYSITKGFSVRPSIVLKPTIEISKGKGTISNPYILEEDTQEIIGGTTLLSTRYSGEYVNFNKSLYRIVAIEEGITKITAIDKLSEISNNAFDSEWGLTNFAESDIKADLENYYQGLKSSNAEAYNMIEPNTTWYLGEIDAGDNYKATICTTIDISKSMNECEEKASSTLSNIGLPRVGEMFTSQITRGTTQVFWTLTPVEAGGLMNYIGTQNTLEKHYTTRGYGARPSMYLKSNVVIASNNTGNGTYEHPYKLSLN